MTTGNDSDALTLPPVLAAEVQAAADEESRPVGERLGAYAGIRILKVADFLDLIREPPA